MMLRAQAGRRKENPCPTAAAALALALPPLLLAVAMALATALLELPRQFCTVGSEAAALAKDCARPFDCASAAASACAQYPMQSRLRIPGSRYM